MSAVGDKQKTEQLSAVGEQEKVGDKQEESSAVGDKNATASPRLLRPRKRRRLIRQAEIRRIMMINSEMRQQDPDYDPDCECDSCFADAQRYVRAARMVYALVGFGDDSSDEQ